MPWRGPNYPGEFPSLGWTIGDWIEAHCVIPDGDHIGEPYKLTDEMWRFLVHHYRLRETADPARPSMAWRYRRSQLVRPQKWGKGPFSAAIICDEAEGPALFGGWDADGEPVGRPWPTPLIQITATSDDQTANVYSALQPMIELGPLTDLIPDTAETRINLRGGGRIDPVTSNARSRLGQRVTFVLQDETGIWVKSNRGHELADAQKRGLAGMGGRAIETTNAWNPSENSVAQQTAATTVDDVYRDHVEAPKNLSIRNKAERRKILRAVYGDSWWVDLDRIDAEAVELLDRGEDSQAERFFGNRAKSGRSSWLREGVWERAKRPRTVEPGTQVCLGFDGSETDDWTAITAETLDGYSFIPTYGPDARPTFWDPAQFDGRIPVGEVNAAMDELTHTYRVVRGYFDPRAWRSQIEEYQLQYGTKKIVIWETNRITQMHESLKRFTQDLANGDITHDNNRVRNEHVDNARKVARPGERYILGKPTQHQKIDLAMTTVLAHEARCDAVAAGALKARSRPRAIVLS
jgi:hypothetical protein